MIHRQVCSLRLESKFKRWRWNILVVISLREQLEATFSCVLASDPDNTPSQRGHGGPVALQHAELRSFVFPLWTVLPLSWAFLTKLVLAPDSTLPLWKLYPDSGTLCSEAINPLYPVPGVHCILRGSHHVSCLPSSSREAEL